MKIHEVYIKKTVTTLSDKEIKRQAKLTVSLPENADEADQIFGEDLWKWARHGFLAHAKISVSNKLIGATDKSMRKQIRQFKESLRTLVDIMEQPRDQAINFLLANEKFSNLADYVKEMEAGEELQEFTFSDASTVKKPRWFETGEEESDEDEDEADAAKQ